MGLKEKVKKFGPGLIIGGLVVGMVYLAYRKGHVDSVSEICDIVADQGETTFRFRLGNRVSAIAMQQID